jgi:methanethiol S-methyltransferase
MKKFLLMSYAVCAYIVGLLNIAYIVAFLGDFIVPKTISGGTTGAESWLAASFNPADALKFAILANTGLVLIFGLHHSITARRWFKALWTRIVPPSIERATYLYMTAAMSVLLIGFWQPIPISIWQIDEPWAVNLITGLYLAVWAIMLSATFHFGHFGFFGLAQAWNRIRERESRPASFTAKYLYAVVRHPISFGWMVTPWLTPHFTAGHLVFAISVAVYVLIATIFEESDLISELGEDYREYRRRVPAFFPRLR